MAIFNSGMSGIKKERKENQRQEEWGGPRQIGSPRRTHSSKHAKGQAEAHERVGDLKRFVAAVCGGQAPESCPEEADASKSDPTVLEGVCTEVGERKRPLFLHVGELADAPHLRHFSIVVWRVGPVWVKVGSIASVALPENQPKIVAKRDEVMKDD